MSDTPPIEAEVVPSAMVVRKPRKAKTYAPVLSSGDKVGKFSEKEAKFLKALIKSGNIRIASEEVGIGMRTGERYAAKPHVRAYIEKMRLRAAKAADLTFEKVTGVVNDALEGREVTQTQLAAAALATKFLGPAKGPSTVINQQNNFSGPSPYAGMSREEMVEQMKRSLLEYDGE